jgi:hypothetical protein
MNSAFLSAMVRGSIRMLANKIGPREHVNDTAGYSDIAEIEIPMNEFQPSEDIDAALDKLAPKVGILAILLASKTKTYTLPFDPIGRDYARSCYEGICMRGSVVGENLRLEVACA